MRITTMAVALLVAAAVAVVPTAADATPPVVINDSFQTEVGTAKDFNVLTNDAADAGNSGKSLTVTGWSDPAHATVSCTTTGLCTYTPDNGWTGGKETFTYTASDGVDSAQGTVSVETFNVGTVDAALARPDGTTFPYKWPYRVDVSAIVKDPSGAALRGVEVTLYAKYPPGTSWSLWSGGAVYEPIASGITDARGMVSVLDQRPQRATYYQWRTADTRSRSAPVGVTPRIWGLTLPSRVAVGDVTAVSGSSVPATAGDVISVGCFSTQTHTFDVDSTSTVRGTGAPFSFEITPDASGARACSVWVPSQSGLYSESKRFTIEAYDAEISRVRPGSTADPDEYVTVKNLGTVPLELEDWVLSDGAHTLVLPARNVPTDSFVRIHTGAGKNTLRNLYLGVPEVWNDDDGTITLVDNNGFELGESFTYPVAP